MLALLGRLWLGEEDFLVDIGRELPAVGRVRFLDVDDEELDAVFVLLVELLQAPGLLAEGRSGV